MDEWLPTTLGTVVGLLSASSFAPQVLKAWRERDTAAISRRMYMVPVTAFVLWTVYGFLRGSLPLMVFNLLSLVMSGTILLPKIRTDGQGAGATPEHREPGMANPG